MGENHVWTMLPCQSKIFTLLLSIQEPQMTNKKHNLRLKKKKPLDFKYTNTENYIKIWNEILNMKWNLGHLIIKTNFDEQMVPRHQSNWVNSRLQIFCTYRMIIQIPCEVCGGVKKI